MFYSLWDLDTGTSLGTYATEEEAREVARSLIEVNGLAYAEVLELSRHDDAGRVERIGLSDIRQDQPARV